MQFSTILKSIVALAAGLSPVQAVLLPSQDPFYTQPANIASYKNGAIVKSRTLPPKIQGLVPVINVTVGGLYEYMYRTTDSVGNAVGSVMTYIVPLQSNNTNLLSYSIEYDRANNDNAPSYSIQPGANENIGYDLIFIQAALNNGWHVVTSDYEGLEAQFSAGVQSGHAALDSIRASLNASVRASTGLSADAKYALLGYSGGSIAAEWAAELAPNYAADLTNFVGTAIGGVVANLTNALLTLNGTPGAGLALAASYGLAKAYNNLSAEFNKTLVPSKAAQYYQIAGSTNPMQYTLVLNQDVFSFFTPGRAILNDDVVKSVLAAGGQMGTHGVPKMPMFVYKAKVDEVDPIVDTDRLVAQYCSQGVTIQYQRNDVGEHITEAVLGTPNAFAWLVDRFNGVPTSQTQPISCYIQNVTIDDVQQSGAVAEFGNTLASLLEVTLGNPFQTWNNTNATGFTH